MSWGLRKSIRFRLETGLQLWRIYMETRMLIGLGKTLKRISKPQLKKA